jgi:hypothetical protein
LSDFCTEMKYTRTLVAAQVDTAQAHFTAVMAQAYLEVEQPEAELDPSPISLQERGTQKALPSTSANDRLLKLQQNKLF